MGRYDRRRNVRKFWENPMVNLCFTLSVLAFVAGLFGLFAFFGGANTLVFSILTLVIGILLIILGNRLKARAAPPRPDSPVNRIRRGL